MMHARVRSNAAKETVLSFEHSYATILTPETTPEYSIFSFKLVFRITLARIMSVTYSRGVAY